MLSKFRSFTRNFYIPTWYFPIALLVLTLISYGLRALGLGFFWDDWPYLWFFHRFGPAGIINAFEGDRPFLSFIYISSLSVFGNSSQAWQIFALVARWLCSLSFWWALSLTWPRHKNKAAWAAVLFAVYPGFTQQWIAVIYGQAFILYASLFFSIGVTLWLARHRGTLARGWIAAGTLLALALSGFTMYSTEYFFGLELLRPALLWIVLAGCADLTASRARLRQQVWRIAKWWAPNLILMITFVVWRGFIHPFLSYSMTTLNQAEKNPLSALWNLSLVILHDFITAGVVAWGQATQQFIGIFENDPANGLRLLGIVLVSGLVCFLFLLGLRSAQPIPETPTNEAAPRNSGEHWGTEAVLIGLFAFLASGWPTWITGLPMRMGFPQDRYSLALAPGICLIIAGLIDLLGGQARSQNEIIRKAVVVSALAALAVGFHFNSALLYRQDWNVARDFFWQLTWRVPSVQPNTLFASDSMPFQYFEDDSLSAPLNWTYDPNGRSAQMSYILYDMLTRRLSFPSYAPGLPVIHAFRAAHFSGSTDSVLVFSYAPPGCVRILDPVYDADLYRLPDRVQQALPISKPAKLIQDSAEPATPPQDIFGSEPKHRWCYYFEKADLARQKQDWQAIKALSQQSIKIGYRPEDPSEYLPFIEAYARLGEYDEAYQLTQAANYDSQALRPALCAVWKRSYQAAADSSGMARKKLNKYFSCSIP